MSNKARLFIGPELIWLVLLGVAMMLAAGNQPPTVEGNQRLEAIGWFLPPVGIMLSLVPFSWMERAKWWCLARFLVAGAISVVAVTTTLCGAMQYDDSRDSGVGTAWMVFIGLGGMLLIFCGAVVAVTLLVRRAARPKLGAR